MTNKNHSDDNLERIRELTKTAVPLSVIAVIKSGDVEYKTYNGTCGGHELMYIDEIAVQMAYMQTNTMLESHCHDEVEILVVYEGEITIHMQNELVRLGPGDIYKIKPGVFHLAESKEGCKMIGITIPASKGYPHG
jgi:mannose-6-phosphate isomerase-like protein (cupin superfamily)